MLEAAIDTRAEQATLRAILTRAGTIGLSHFHNVRASLKPDGSQVTDADLQAESALVESLTQTFPGTGIVAEEGEHILADGPTWFVDPIDGTGAFLDGLAHWGPTICLVDDEGPLVGATWFPLIGEFWYARRGSGAWRNNTRLRTTPLESIHRNHSILVPSRFHRLPAIPWRGKVRALGSTAAHLALVAGNGPVATIISEGWRMWDVGTGALLVQEAGRTIVDMRGEVYHPAKDGGRGFIAGDATAVAALLPLLNAARRDG